jgi:hypothetical protein
LKTNIAATLAAGPALELQVSAPLAQANWANPVQARAELGGKRPAGRRGEGLRCSGSPVIGVSAAAPHAAERAVADADRWAAATLDGLGAPAAAIAVGGGPAWAAALELALMLKEIARIPAEGVETREGATSAMFGLDRGHLMVSLDAAGDPLGDEAVRLCAAAGATALRLPGATHGDARLAPITTLPAAAALSAGLALAAGHDVDRPTWTDAYYATARSAK